MQFVKWWQENMIVSVKFRWIGTEQKLKTNDWVSQRKLTLPVLSS